MCQRKITSISNVIPELKLNPSLLRISCQCLLYNIISSNTSTKSKCHIENQMNIFFSVFWIAMKNKIYMMRKKGINWPKLRIFTDVKNWGCCFVFFTGECWETKWLVMTVVRSVMKQTGRAGETYIQKEEERDDLKLIIPWFFGRSKKSTFFLKDECSTASNNHLRSTDLFRS